jgi:allantoinase
MADADLVLRDGNLVLADGVAPGDVAVIDGRIACIGASLPVTGATEIDAAGLHVFPGGVDPHVHFNEPGRTDWEGIVSGSTALAVGGFTTYVDMPLNCIPVTIDVDAFDQKQRAVAASSRVDFGLWAGLVPGSLASLEPLVGRGVMGFKAFLCDSGIAEFPPLDDATLYEAMRRCAELGSIVLVHAENAAIVGELGRRAIAAGRLTWNDFANSRPIIAELEAISRALFFAGETGCAIHVVHVSNGRGVRLVETARQQGVDATCETCPHYLLLTADDVQPLGAVAKCAPPLRSAAERDGLWALIGDGVLDMVASDHSPCPPELKDESDFFKAWGGISGCQTTLQLVLAEGWARRGIDLPSVARLTSASAARRFGLPRKGTIRVGHDADLAVLDLATEWLLESEDLRYRHRQSPYLGRRLRGRVKYTFLRGQTVVMDGDTVGPPAGVLVTAERTLTRS